MSSDDLDDVLEGGGAEMEARFRELERDAELEQLRRRSGAAPRQSEPPRSGGTPPPSAQAAGAAEGSGGAGGGDPLADLKAAVSGDAKLERFLLVLCPKCGAKNRMSLTRVRSLDPGGPSGFTSLGGRAVKALPNPVCGRCKGDLSFTKY